MDLNKNYAKAFSYCDVICYFFYNRSLFFQIHLFLLEGEVNSLRSGAQSAVQQHLVGYSYFSSRS